MKRPCFAINIGLVCWALTSTLSARAQAPGTLDASFGAGGKVFTSFAPGSSDNANAVTRQPDGKLVVAGSGTNGATLARYNPDGSLDSSFGTGGLVTTHMGTSPPSSLYPNGSSGALSYSVILQPADGKILVAGRRGHQFMVARYLPDGTLDSSFGVNGLYTDAAANLGNTNRKVLLDASGRLLVVGAASGPSSIYVVVRRLQSNGTLDRSYGSNGLAHSPSPPTLGTLQDPRDALLDAAGNLVITGHIKPANGTPFAAALRLLPDGSPDPSFGLGGIAAHSGPQFSYGYGLALQPDGKLVLSGSTAGGGMLYRITATGAPDTGFGTGGMASSALGHTGTQLSRVLVQPDGKLVGVGYKGYWAEFIITRILPNGTLDPAFGTNGHSAFPETGAAELTDVLLQPDGKLVAVGISYAQRQGFGPARFAVFRFLNTVATPTKAGNQLPAVAVFPQPAGQFLTLQSPLFSQTAETLQLTITNALGQAVLNQTCKSSSAQPGVRVDVSRLTPGIYTLRGRQGSYAFSHSLTIAR